jgi:hypothetical protein
MAEVRVILPDAFIALMQEKLGREIKATEITREAITLFNWAVEQRAKGNVLQSATPEGEKTVQLSMPVLEEIKPRA